jgi:conjugal transfer ATP-binding protein TraC
MIMRHSLIQLTPANIKKCRFWEMCTTFLMESQETRRMGNILNRLVHGSAKTFNQHTNVDLSNPYTVLDISELTGDLLTVGMFRCTGLRLG